MMGRRPPNKGRTIDDNNDNEKNNDKDNIHMGEDAD